MKLLLPIALLLLGTAEAQVAALPPARSPAGACGVIAPDAQDGPIASPENHTILYEDADVRVLDVHSRPHTREAWHTHARPGVMYVDRQGPGRYMTPANPNERVRGPDPNFTFRIFATAPEALHATENTGDIPFHAIRVEFKHPGCNLSPRTPVVVPGPDDALVAAPAVYTLLLENADVRVLDVHLPPHTKEPMHTDPWAGFFYILQDSPQRRSTPDRKQPEALPLHAGEPKIVPVGAEGLHAIENVGDVTLHYIRFELKHATPKAGA